MASALHCQQALTIRGKVPFSKEPLLNQIWPSNLIGELDEAAGIYSSNTRSNRLEGHRQQEPDNASGIEGRGFVEAPMSDLALIRQSQPNHLNFKPHNKRLRILSCGMLSHLTKRASLLYSWLWEYACARTPTTVSKAPSTCWC